MPVLPVLVALVSLVLAACSSVPTSGPIEQGPVVDAGESTQFIRVIAAPPSQGASPAVIVRGFLESGASLEQDHAISRRYLTTAAAESWQADASTTVFEQSTLKVSKGSDGRVVARLAVNGELAEDGSLTLIDPAVPRTVEFHLEQVQDGASSMPEWRITDPPPGLLISDADLRRAYRLHQAYFPSARSSVLVPDGRMLPVIGPALTTTLAERVLTGPAAWLAPGVRQGAPPGTALALGAVPVTNGVAVVELTDQALSATDTQRRDLASQLTWTLTQLPEVVAIRLLVGGEPYQVPGAPELMDRAAWAARGPDATSLPATGTLASYTLDGATIVRVSDTSRTSIPIAAADADTLEDLAVSLDQRYAAAVAADASALLVLPLDRGVSERRIPGRDVGGPSFDVDGQLWFAEGGGIRRLQADGTVEQVPVRGDEVDAEVTAVALARDGARIAVLAGGEPYLGVLATRGGQLQVSSLHRTDTVVERASDLAWRDATSVDLLGSAAGAGRQVLRVAVGSGQVLSLGAPGKPAGVAAAPAAVTLVANDDAQVFANVGLQWRERGPGRSVAYPG